MADVKLRIIIEALNKSANEINKVATSLSGIEVAAKKIGKSTTETDKVVASLNSITEAAKKVGESTKEAGASGTEGLSEIAKKGIATKTALEGIDKAATLLGNSLKDAGADSAKGLSEIEKKAKATKEVFERLNQVADKFSAIGTRLIAMGAALSAAVFFPLKQAADFEHAMSVVRAVIEGTESAYQDLEKEAARLGVSTRFTATEAAQGLKYLGMAGLSANDALKALEPSLSLAAAGELEVKEAAEISTNIMAAMNLKVQDLTHVIDVLAWTAAKSNTDIRQMAEGLRYVGPIAAAAGITIEETSSIIGILGNNGIQASLAGVALRGVIVSLLNPTEKAKKALDELHVEVSYFKDGSLDLVKTLKDLQKAGLGVTAATDIFRRTSAPAALALAKNTDEVERLLSSLDKVEGATEKMAKTMLDNLKGAWIKFTSAVEGLNIAIGTPLLNPLTKILEKITTLVGWLKVAAEEYPKIVGIITFTIGGIGQLLIVIGTLSFALGGILKTILAIRDVYVMLKTLGVVGWLIDLKVKMTLFRGSTHLATTAVIGLKLAMYGLYGVAIALSTAIVYEGYKTYQIWKENKDMAEQNVKASEKYTEAMKKSLLTTREINNLSQQGLMDYRRELVERLKGQTELWKAAVRTNDEEAINKYNTAMDSTLALLEKVRQKSKAAFTHPEILATIDNMDEFKKTATEAYDEAMKKAEEYGKKVIEWEDKIKYEKLSTEDKIRELGRKTLTDQQAFNDERLQAEQKLSQARKAIAQGDFDLAEKLAKDSQALYAGLAREVDTVVTKFVEAKKEKDTYAREGGQFVKDIKGDFSEMVSYVKEEQKEVTTTLKQGVATAQAGVKATGSLITEIYDVQKKAALTTQNDFSKLATAIKKELDDLTRLREINLKPKLVDLLNVEDELNAFIEKMSLTKKITIQTEAISPTEGGMSKGGPVVRRARGGKIPGGDSKYDSVPVLARPGEWFIKNEAVKNWESKFGNGFMYGINNPWSDFGKRLQNVFTKSNAHKFNAGGEVSPSLSPRLYKMAYAGGGSVGGIRNLGTVSINMGNHSFPMLGDVKVIEQLKMEIEKEKLMRPNRR